MLTVNDIRKKLVQEKLVLEIYKKEYNETGEYDNHMIELINVQFVADKDWLVRKPNEDYIKRELDWYLSQSLNVNDIPGETPQIWKQVSDKDGLINSNYGWCIFSNNNYNQYNEAKSKLLADKNTRQAQMIYSRPSMQVDWNKNGMHDFMCTNHVNLHIREDKLIYTVFQRSCDAVFGYPNDLAWHKFVYNKLFNELKDTYKELEESHIVYNCGSLHLYPRHQHLLTMDILNEK